MEVSPGELCDRLSIVNLKIWHLETDIRSGKEDKISKVEIADKALTIRDFNKERVALKNAINELFGKGFRETKVDHSSE